MPDFVFDAWAGHTPEELKNDCRRLNRIAHAYERIAMIYAANFGTECLPEPYKSRIDILLKAYSDDDDF